MCTHNGHVIEDTYFEKSFPVAFATLVFCFLNNRHLNRHPKETFKRSLVNDEFGFCISCLQFFSWVFFSFGIWTFVYSEESTT